jgi:hypothetical protein
MGRILVCECKQEISSFNPGLGRCEDFIVTCGAEILACHRPGRAACFSDSVEWTPAPHIFERRNRR